MKLLKCFTAISLALVMALPVCNVFAVTSSEQLDNKYWPLQEGYNKAKESEDTSGIISYGKSIMELFIGGESPVARAAQWKANGDLELNIMRDVANAVAKAYEKQNDFQNARTIYETALPLDVAWQEVNNPEDTEFIRMAYENKIAAYDTSFSVYAEIKGNGGDTSYYGAKHEPKTGVYFGECYNTDDRQVNTGVKQSAALFYVLYEIETIEQFDYLLKPFSQSRQIIEIAWNLVNEGDTLAKVLNDRAKIEAEADYLKKLGTPILLRFGAEMNVWQKKADPEQFKTVFKFVSQIMKDRAPNVAMLWSPNWLGHVETTYDQFYPGDEYVDWVGASLYSVKYPKGKPADDIGQAIYLSDNFANPVRQLSHLVKEYGDRKPIIVSECGIENYSVTRNEYTNAWANTHMKAIYESIPMVYPQVKAILYFNTDSPIAWAENRFSLFNNNEMQAVYKELTKSSRLIPFGSKESGVTYKKIDKEITLSADVVPFTIYTPYFKKDGLTVNYFIDEKWVGASNMVPHRQNIDLSKLGGGAHVFKVVMSAEGKELKTNEYVINLPGGSASATVSALVAQPTASTVLVNGKNVAFDAYNIDGRNYFKLRDLAFTLSGTEKQFDVGWDGVNNAISLTNGVSYTVTGGEMSSKGSGNKTPVVTTAKIFLDGTEVSFTAYNIDGNNYFMLRDMGQAFDFGVDWNGEINTIIINTNIGYN